MIRLKQLIKKLKRSTASREERYLANSCDLVELERRQKELQRGDAPWQVIENKNLKGWV